MLPKCPEEERTVYCACTWEYQNEAAPSGDTSLLDPPFQPDSLPAPEQWVPFGVILTSNKKFLIKKGITKRHVIEFWKKCAHVTLLIFPGRYCGHVWGVSNWKPRQTDKSFRILLILLLIIWTYGHYVSPFSKHQFGRPYTWMAWEAD